MSSRPTNFQFCIGSTIVVDNQCVSSPVQTLSGGCDWFEQPQTSAFSLKHAAAIKADGTLWLWGKNGGGGPANPALLGDFSTIDRSSPVQTVSTGTNWKQVSLGINHSASIKTDGTLWLWGDNGDNKINDRGTNVDFSSPVQTVSQATNWKQVSLGCENSAAVKLDGTLWLWGNNGDGQLGDNTRTSRNSPVQTISQGNNWKQVSLSSGLRSSAAIKTDGTLWLWGISAPSSLDLDYWTMLGDNSNRAGRSSPVQTVSTGTNWKQVSVGYKHVTAIKTDGTMWIWGNNNQQQLGTLYYVGNTGAPYYTPIRCCGVKSPSNFVGGTNWSQVSAGCSHNSAIKTDGTLWGWGTAGGGFLGNNGLGNFSPVQTVSNVATWKQTNSGVKGTIAVKYDGTLWNWGLSENGQLGNNSTRDRSSPVQTVSNVTTWTEECAWCSFSAGGDHSAAIKTDGTLWLWGRGSGGRLGINSNADQSSPVQTVSTGTNWKQVSLGATHSGAIKTDGTLWLWGIQYCGMLGNNTNGGGAANGQSSPVQTVSTGTNWKQVALGDTNSAAVKTDGTLWTWGYGLLGQLGNNSTIARSSPVQTVSTGTNWKQVAAGCHHISSIKTDGTLWIWGGGANGRLGNNSTINQSSPVQTVSQGTDWQQVSLGRIHSTSVKSDGTLWLWGENANGRIGNNSEIDQSSPVQTVSTGTNWKQVEAGSQHTASVKIDGTLWLWGLNSSEQLGNGNTIDRSSPVQTVSTGTSWLQVSLGDNHSLALNKNDQLYGWGLNTFGQLGCHPNAVTGVTRRVDLDDVFVRREFFVDGGLWGWGANINGRLGTNNTLDSSSPVQTISGGTNWKQVSAAMFSTDGVSAAIKTDGTLWLWGENGCGQLGDNSLVARSSPVQTVSTGTNWKNISVSGNHSASIKTDGTLWLWGCGAAGRLGTNSTTTRVSPVQTVSTGANWKQVSLGATHSAAVKTDGTLWLWGANNLAGPLGNYNTVSQSSPVQTVSTGTNWKQVSLGTGHSAAVKTDGTLWLWGCAGEGRLGNNSWGTVPSPINQSSPVQTVSTGTNWKQVNLKCSSAAIKTDGTLWLWGEGGLGRLGDNSGTSKSSPVQTISGGTNWRQVDLGVFHSAAIKTDGTLWLWGIASDGRLGNNSTVGNISSPVQTISSGTNWRDVSLGCHSLAIRENCW